MNKITEKDIKIETALLKLLQNKLLYERYVDYIDLKRVLPNTKILIEDYKRYYENYPKHTYIDFSVFYTDFAQFYHEKDKEFTVQDVEYYRDFVFPAINAYELTDSDSVIKSLDEKIFKEDVAKCLEDGADTTQLHTLLENHIKKTANEGDSDVATVDNVDFDALDKSEGIPWFLPSLQRGIYSLSAGQFVIISADFGTGKSAFVIHQAVHTFKHLHKKNDNRPILYFNSEGLAADVIGRFLSNLYKEHVVRGFEEIVERREEIRKKFIKSFDPSVFKCIQLSNTPTFAHIKSKVLKYKPALVIIDICDKLAPEEDVQSLKKLYDNLRVLAGTGYPIIGTSQSGNTTYFDTEKKEVVKQRWLNDSSLYGSKTGKGGAADTIITIGREENSKLRYVAVVKKKRGSEVKITCELNDIYSEYKEILY